MDNAPNSIPEGYLITFRTYGTWLHGDDRLSQDRNHRTPCTPRLPPNRGRRAYAESRLLRDPVTLSAQMRRAVRHAVDETLIFRGWYAHAINVRTNHVHTVVTADVKPERVLNALKANATRTLRERGLWSEPMSPWSAGGSTKYLWDAYAVARASEYVVYGQGPPLD